MILGIETATAHLGVALAEHGRIAGHATIDRPHAHDEQLAPLCREVLRSRGITAEALNAIAVSAGPGSFTGLRIGMAVAKGMALSLAIPLVTVPTMDAIAFGLATGGVDPDAAGGETAPEPDAPAQDAAVFLHARRDEVYAAWYLLQAGAFFRKSGPLFLPTAEAASRVRDGMLLAGDAAAAVRAAAGGNGRLVEHPDADARTVALLGEQMILRGDIADAASCEPLYIQEFEVKQGKNLLSRP